MRYNVILGLDRQDTGRVGLRQCRFGMCRETQKAHENAKMQGVMPSHPARR
jgi:hypothetical protein